MKAQATLTVVNPDVAEFVAFDLEMDVPDDARPVEIQGFAVAIWDEAPEPGFEAYLPFSVTLR